MEADCKRRWTRMNADGSFANVDGMFDDEKFLPALQKVLFLPACI